jgi:hypothetical protein
MYEFSYPGRQPRSQFFRKLFAILPQTGGARPFSPLSRSSLAANSHGAVLPAVFPA